MIKSNFRTGSDIINLIKLGVNDIIIYLGLLRMYPVTSISAAVVTCDSVIYNRSNQVALNIVVTLEGNTLVEYRDYVVSSNSGGTNVGNYTVTITGIDNYEGTANGTFTINKANPTYTAPTGKSLTYNGSAQSLVNGGYSNDGIILYSTDNSNWSATIPTQTNVGNYTTYWRFIGDGGNFYDISSTSLSSSIAKANQSAPTVSGSTVAYGNTAYASASGGGGYGSIEWSNGSSLSGNAGSSKSTLARWSGDGNHNASDWSNSVTLSIVKADQSAPTASGSSVSYGNTAIATASGGGGQGSLEWSNGNTRTALGSQSTQARWSGNSNYNASGWSNSVTLSVTEASYNGHQYMDLGLSVKWATMNLGASAIGEYGDYKAYNGTDHIASDWGGNWRMPTYDEGRELIENTNASAVTINGYNCIKLTSKTNSNLFIYLPLAGIKLGSSSSNIEDAGSKCVISTKTLKDSTYVYTIRAENGLAYMSFDYHYYGSIRGVF